MAGAKKHARRKKRRSTSSPSPTSPSIRSVRTSSALSAREAAPHLGIRASTLRRWARAGLIPASIDERGHYHFAWKSVLSASLKPSHPRKKRAKTSRETRAPRPVRSNPSTPAPRPVKKRPPPPPPRRKKKKRAPTIEPRFVRRVAESSSPTLAEAARSFGVSSLRLLELVRAGVVRALLDAKGVFHIPGALLQARELERRKKRKAKARKKRPSKKTTGKKLVRRKKKRVRKTKPAAERFRDAIIDDTRPSAYAEPPRAPDTPPSAASPMVVERAAERVGGALRDFVMARPRWERLATGRVFHDLKTSFRSTYGNGAWKEWYAWMVDEWDLEDYIFDYEALRDS